MSPTDVAHWISLYNAQGVILLCCKDDIILKLLVSKTYINSQIGDFKIPGKWWFRPDLTETLLNGTLNLNTNDLNTQEVVAPNRLD